MAATISIGLARLVLPDTGARIAAELRSLASARGATTPVLFVGEPALASRTRVFLRGKIELVQSSQPTSAALEQAELALLFHQDTETLGPGWSALHSFQQGFHRTDVLEVARAMARGELEQLLDSKRQKITIAARRVPAHEQLAGGRQIK
jgi:hypothetical protein